MRGMGGSYSEKTEILTCSISVLLTLHSPASQWWWRIQLIEQASFYLKSLRRRGSAAMQLCKIYDDKIYKYKIL